MGWDYSAVLVYGVMLNHKLFPRDCDDQEEFVYNLVKGTGVRYAVFSFFGSEHVYVLHDEGMARVVGLKPVWISIPEVTPLSEGMQRILDTLGSGNRPAWFMGISVS